MTEKAKNSQIESMKANAAVVTPRTNRPHWMKGLRPTVSAKRPTTVTAEALPMANMVRASPATAVSALSAWMAKSG